MVIVVACPLVLGMGVLLAPTYKKKDSFIWDFLGKRGGGSRVF
jgi:hypothetical protein